MIRALLAFILVFVFFYFSIIAFRLSTKRQKWKLTKIVGYSILCSALTITVLTTFVILF